MQRYNHRSCKNCCTTASLPSAWNKWHQKIEQHTCCAVLTGMTAKQPEIATAELSHNALLQDYHACAGDSAAHDASQTYR
jgi:hypothetical protein